MKSVMTKFMRSALKYFQESGTMIPSRHDSGLPAHKECTMPMSSAVKQRRLCLALPAVILAGATSSAAQAQSLLGTTPARMLGIGGYDVALSVDLFGESSKHVVRAWNTERVTVTGSHSDTPWLLEFIITRFKDGEKLLVSTKLMSGADVLAAPVRTSDFGQRVVVRADDAMNVALVIKNV